MDSDSVIDIVNTTPETVQRLTGRFNVCLDDIQLGLGSWVATFWERAANSVYRMFFT